MAPLPTTTAAPGETSLSALLSTMTPVLQPQTYVFATTRTSSIQASEAPLLQASAMMFREAEGLTFITPQSAVDEYNASQEGTGAGMLQAAFPCRMITLNVHSSLEAVGFIATVAKRLAELGIGVNPVSGFYHDHLFVPEGREEDAMGALKEMVKHAKGKEGLA